MGPKVLQFSVRGQNVTSLSALHLKIEDVFECKLDEGEFHGIPAMTGKLLGMKIVLLQWVGLGGTSTVQLHGFVDDPVLVTGTNDKSAEVQVEDISEAIIHLLAVKTGHSWWIPSPEEVQAEIEYGERLRKEFLTEEEDI